MGGKTYSTNKKLGLKADKPHHDGMQATPTLKMLQVRNQEVVRNHKKQEIKRHTEERTKNLEKKQEKGTPDEFSFGEEDVLDVEDYGSMTADDFDL